MTLNDSVYENENQKLRHMVSSQNSERREEGRKMREKKKQEDGMNVVNADWHH